MIRPVCLALILVFVTYLGADNADNDDDDVFDQGFPDKCLTGEDHKNSPSAETGDFPICELWKDFGCCTVDTVNRIAVNHSIGIRFISDTCGQMTDSCQKYTLADECFYQCEPMLKYWGISEPVGSMEGAPICAMYCDEWFEACKDTMTCVDNWLTLFSNENSPACTTENGQCVTFAEMYGDAKDLCNMIWGSAYKYEASNKDCMVMMFDGDGDNPNEHGDFYSAADTVSSHTPVYILFFTFVLFI